VSLEDAMKILAFGGRSKILILIRKMVARDRIELPTRGFSVVI
jgi:hypothetical protein